MIERNGAPVAPVRDGDGIVLFNFRADRMPQIVRALTAPGFDGFAVGARPKADIVTMTMYDETFTLPVAFRLHARADRRRRSDGRGMTMFRTAETERRARDLFLQLRGY